VAVAPSHHDDAPHAVELLYRQHATALRSYCRRRVGPDDADEVVQTTFLRALRALNRGERPYAERAWLLTIARNVCASRATSAAHRHELLDPRPLEAASAPTAGDGHDAELAAALRALPEGQRRAFVLRAVHELSYDEIAAELNVSRAAVESWIFRARRKLAAAVGERRRRLALDLSTVAGAAKSLVAANAVKVAAVTAVAGTALTVGPAVPARQPAPHTPRPSVPHAAPVPAPERGAPPPAPARRARTGRPLAPPADEAEPPVPAVPSAPTPAPVVVPSVAAPTPSTAPAPAPVAEPPEVSLGVPLLEEPALELPAVEPPELTPLLPPLPTVDPNAIVPSLPDLP
jgi:RNA polymerase sigma-70 factor (ECF subfamily)